MASRENVARRRRELGQRIRAARLALGLSQEELATRVAQHVDEAGTLTQGSVSYWESGRSLPRDEHVEALEIALRLQTGELRRLAHAAAPPPESSESADVVTAIAADGTLTPEAKAALTASYRALQQTHRPSGVDPEPEGA